MVHPAHIAVDIAVVALASRPTGGRAVSCDMQRLPFRDGSVDFFFTWAALEHVPNPELVLEEIQRTLRPGGAALLSPAWHCRPWAAKALDTRPYSELSWTDRLIKTTIPLRNALLWRAMFEIPARLLRELKLRFERPLPFDYGRLQPNLTEYLGSDSDAFTSMDPHAAIVYFASRGWKTPSHPTLVSRLFARHEPVVVERAQI